MMLISRLGRWGRTGITAGAALLLFVPVVGFAAGSLPPGGSFSDDDGNIHEAAIEAIAAEGITKGCNPPINDLYCPSATVTRGQMAAFLVRALDLPSTADAPFSDAAGVFEDSINRLAAAGITKGCNPPTNTLFCPDSPVKRDQMASFLTRALDLTPITPPPPTTSTTGGGTTPTTLPAVGPSATFTGCGTGVSGVEFSLEQECVFSVITQPTWASSLYTDFYFVWIGPDGQEVDHGCPATGPCTYLTYNYIGSSPIGWTVYFYVDAEDRDPGGYALEIWSGNSSPQTLELRASFLLSEIPPTPTTTTTTTTTTTLPPLPMPDVSWDCVVGGGDVRSCTGNIDTLDPTDESWSCTPTESGYPDNTVPWNCSGDIDKRTPGIEAWSCSSTGLCSGNIDTTDGADEDWEISHLHSGSAWFEGIGDIEKSADGDETWSCDIGGSDHYLSCAADLQPWAWTCDGTPPDDYTSYGGAWSCSGTVGRLAAIVGPVPNDYEWN